MEMKKIAVCVMVTLLLAGLFTGCPTGGSGAGTTPPASMSFADAEGRKEFSIYEDLEFNVKFLCLDGELGPILSGLGIQEGMVISGHVAETQNAWTDAEINGTARGMTTSDPDSFLNDILEDLDLVSLKIRLTYQKDGTGAITGVTVAFPYECGTQCEDYCGMIDLAGISAMLMGGTFLRVAD